MRWRGGWRVLHFKRAGVDAGASYPIKPGPPADRKEVAEKIGITQINGWAAREQCVGVGVGAFCTSNEPASMRVPLTRSNPGPPLIVKRWRKKLGSPKSMAGLPGNNALAWGLARFALQTSRRRCGCLLPDQTRAPR